MKYRDYYKILGVEKNATQDEIKKVYRKLAHQFHPDINPNNRTATTRFAEINEANDVLSDPEKRKKYDLLGADWQQYQSAGRQGSGQEGFDWSKYSSGDGSGSYTYYEGDLNDMFGDGAFSDFFQMFFGTGQRKNRGGSGSHARKGPDYQAELHLNIEETYVKTFKTMAINGQNLRITLEPGMKDNQIIKLNGKGGPGTGGGVNGDLYITLKINPNPVFRREGNDLYMDVPVSVYTAMLGGEQTVRLLSGSIKVKIPAESQNGTTLRIKGKGFPVTDGKDTHGDLYIRLVLELPVGLSAREKELVSELARIREDG